MTWNYRVILFANKADPADSPYYAIHEVYYDEHGKPNGYSVDYATVNWDEDEGVEVGHKIVQAMLVAFAKPVLLASDFEVKGKA